MTRKLLRSIPIAVGIVAGLVGCTTTQQSSSGLDRIQHIVVIMLENRNRASSLCYIAGMRILLYLMMAALPLAAERKPVTPPEFPKGAPFSPGILSDGTLYVSGQAGQDLTTRQIPAEFEAEVKKTLDNIGLVLKAAGMDFKDVVSVNVYLTDMDLFPRMNAVYTTFFPEPRPTRTTVGVTKLAASGARIEITVTARK